MCGFYGEGRGESCGRGGRDRGIFMVRAGLIKFGVTPLTLFAVFGGLVMEFSDVKIRRWGLEKRLVLRKGVMLIFVRPPYE